MWCVTSRSEGRFVCYASPAGCHCSVLPCRSHLQPKRLLSLLARDCQLVFVWRCLQHSRLRTPDHHHHHRTHTNTHLDTPLWVPLPRTMSALKQHGEDRSDAAASVSVGMTEGRGRGLFAAAAMNEGSSILIERCDHLRCPSSRHPIHDATSSM